MFGKNKKTAIFFIIIIFAVCCLLSADKMALAAEPQILQYNFPCPNLSLPGAECPSPEAAAKSPAAYIARLYQFALAAAGALAFGMIIFAGIKYMVYAGNPSQQIDARDQITQAFWGLVLLLSSWLILYIIDPGLVNLRDPNIKTINVPLSPPQTTNIKELGESCGNHYECKSTFCDPNTYQCALSEEQKKKQESGKYQWMPEADCSFLGTKFSSDFCPGTPSNENDVCCGNLKQTTAPQSNFSGGGSGRAGATEDFNRKILDDAGVGAKKTCPINQSTDCVNLNGMKASTINEISELSAKVGSKNVYITGGTEPGHTAGEQSHATGNKADLRLNNELNKYIETNFTYIGERSSGEKQYQSSSGAIYALEKDHWDVLVKS